MTIEQKIQNLLVAANLVDVGNVKQPGNWQGVDGSYLVHECVAVDPIYTYAARQGLWKGLYQVSCFSDSRSLVIALRESVVSAIEADSTLAAFLVQQNMDYEFDSHRHHAALTFDISCNLS